MGHTPSLWSGCERARYQHNSSSKAAVGQLIHSKYNHVTTFIRWCVIVKDRAGPGVPISHGPERHCFVVMMSMSLAYLQHWIALSSAPTQSNFVDKFFLELLNIKNEKAISSSRGFVFFARQRRCRRLNRPRSRRAAPATPRRAQPCRARAATYAASATVRWTRCPSRNGDPSSGLQEFSWPLYRTCLDGA